MAKRTRIFRAKKANAAPLPEHVKKILGPYFPDFDLDQIRVFHGIPFYVTMDAAAFTDGNHIFFKPGVFDPDSSAGSALIGHEVTHSVQFQSHGKWKFRAAYVSKWGRMYKEHRSLNLAYHHNEFEVEARAVEQRIFDDLMNMQRD